LGDQSCRGGMEHPQGYNQTNPYRMDLNIDIKFT